MTDKILIIGALAAIIYKGGQLYDSLQEMPETLVKIENNQDSLKKYTSLVNHKLDQLVVKTDSIAASHDAKIDNVTKSYTVFLKEQVKTQNEFIKYYSLLYDLAEKKN